MGDGTMGVLGVILALYFAPGFVALVREHPNRVAIVVLNLFGGWTVVGWVVALVWAASATRAPPTFAALPATAADEIRQLAELRDRKVLTEAEFQARKRALLGLPPAPAEEAAPIVTRIP